MAIPVIAIPLNQIYKLSADQQQDPEQIKNWCETVILPEVLSTLEFYLLREGIKNIDSLHDVCDMLTDPSSALMFTPVNHQHHHLTPAKVLKCINVVHALETDVLDEAHCTLGVCFVGLTGHEIKKLLHDVQSPFHHQPRSCMSTKSTQSYVDSLTVGHHASDVAWQSTHTGLCVPTLTIGYAPLDVAQ